MEKLMPKMHILMCAGFYDIAGFSKVIEYLATGLVDRGHKVTIGAFMFKRSPQKGNYDFVRIPVENPLKLVRFLENFDIIHSHHAITNYLSFISKKPFIYHYHGAPHVGRSNLYRFSMFLSMRLTRYFIDSVIAISRTAGTELAPYFEDEKIQVVYNGVDTNIFKPGLKDRFRRGTPQFLFVGNLYEHKNIPELLMAFKKLLYIYPNAFLQIVGYGYMYGSIANLIKCYGLGRNVELTGRVPLNDLPNYYASCDVYLTASHWELFDLPVIEAMACGKPIVASSIDVHSEILNESKAGLIYTSGDIDSLNNMIKAAYTSSKKYGDNGLAFAKNHDWRVTTDQLLNVYCQTMASGYRNAKN